MFLVLGFSLCLFSFCVLLRLFHARSVPTSFCDLHMSLLESPSYLSVYTYIQICFLNWMSVDWIDINLIRTRWDLQASFVRSKINLDGKKQPTRAGGVVRYAPIWCYSWNLTRPLERCRWELYMHFRISLWKAFRDGLCRNAGMWWATFRNWFVHLGKWWIGSRTFGYKTSL